MGDRDRHATAPLESVLTDLLALAREQAGAARAGDWDAVHHLATRREEVTARLSDTRLSGPPDEAARERIATLAAAIKAADGEVVAHVTRERERLAREMTQIRRGRTAAGAYAREVGAARHDLLSRYG